MLIIHTLKAESDFDLLENEILEAEQVFREQQIALAEYSRKSPSDYRPILEKPPMTALPTSQSLATPFQLEAKKLTLAKLEARESEAKSSWFPDFNLRYRDIDFDREKLKIYGISLKEAQDQAMASIGGENVSQILAGRERYPVQVRLAPSFRQDPEQIKRTLITTPTGAQIPLSEIALVRFKDGPSMIRDENAQLVGYVYIDIDPEKVDIGTYVNHAKEVLNQKIEVPKGYLISWSGQFENMERVKERLKFVIPLTLIMIMFLLYFNTKSWVKTGIVLLAVPFSLIGFETCGH